MNGGVVGAQLIDESVNSRLKSRFRRALPDTSVIPTPDCTAEASSGASVTDPSSIPHLNVRSGAV